MTVQDLIGRNVAVKGLREWDAAQQHAFDLGFKWPSHGTKIINPPYTFGRLIFIKFWRDRSITHGESSSKNTIAFEQFMAITPTPVEAPVETPNESGKEEELGWWWSNDFCMRKAIGLFYGAKNRPLFGLDHRENWFSNPSEGNVFVKGVKRGSSHVKAENRDVIKALRKEAIRRGLKEGVEITVYRPDKQGSFYFLDPKPIYSVDVDGNFCRNYCPIMKNGIWAEVINEEQPSVYRDAPTEHIKQSYVAVDSATTDDQSDVTVFSGIKGIVDAGDSYPYLFQAQLYEQMMNRMRRNSSNENRQRTEEHLSQVRSFINENSKGSPCSERSVLSGLGNLNVHFLEPDKNTESSLPEPMNFPMDGSSRGKKKKGVTFLPLK